MAYIDRANLVNDPTFQWRLSACVGNEAAGKPPDAFTDLLLRSPLSYGGQVFGTLVVSLPGFDRDQAAISDGDILSAVQSQWDRAAALFTG